MTFEATFFLDLGAVVLVCAAAWLLGWLLRRALGLGGDAYRPTSEGAVDVALGLSLLHVLLLGLDLADVRWSLFSVSVAWAVTAWVLAAVGRRLGAGSDPEAHREGAGDRGHPRLSLGWGDGVALAVTGWLVLLAHTGVATTPDFIYQWGVKGHRFLLAGAIDWGYLASSLGNAPSPDYPNLIPNSFVLTSLLRGGFSEGAAALWVAVWLLLVWAGVRTLCAAAGMSRRLAQALIAVTLLLVGMFTTGYQLAGGGDLIIAGCLLLALLPLLSWRGPTDDLALGAAVALAAASKQEGLPLGLFLVTIHLLSHRHRLGAQGGSANLLFLLRVVAVPVAVVAPWALQVFRYDLLGATHGGGLPRLSALPEVLAAVGASLQVPEWHGLGWLVLLVPVLLVPRSTRPAGLVLLLQSFTYLAVYMGHSGETVRPYVMVNAPRLVFHLVPAALVVAAAYLIPWRNRGRNEEEAPRADARWAGRPAFIALVVLVLWSAFGFGMEQARALAALQSREASGVVARWRLGEDRPQSLRRFLEQVDLATYPGSVLAFDPEVSDGDQQFYLTLWAAYLLPENPVIPADRPDALEVAQYLVTYNHQRAPPGAEPVFRHPSGAVFWLGAEREKQ